MLISSSPWNGGYHGVWDAGNPRSEAGVCLNKIESVPLEFRCTSFIVGLSRDDNNEPALAQNLDLLGHGRPRDAKLPRNHLDDLP